MRAQSVSAAVRARMTGRDRRLEGVWAQRAAQPLGTVERREPATDEKMVPAPAVLIEQQDRLSRRSGSRPLTRRMDLHQREQAVNLRLVRREPGQDPAEPKRLLAEPGPHPLIAGGGGIALVEDEIDDLEHRCEARSALGPARNLEGHACLGESPLGPHDPLGDGGLGNEKRARDLRGRQPADQT